MGPKRNRRKAINQQGPNQEGAEAQVQAQGDSANGQGREDRHVQGEIHPQLAGLLSQLGQMQVNPEAGRTTQLTPQHFVFPPLPSHPQIQAGNPQTPRPQIGPLSPIPPGMCAPRTPVPPVGGQLGAIPKTQLPMSSVPKTPGPLTPSSQGPGGSGPRTPGPLTPGSQGPRGLVPRTPGPLTRGTQEPGGSVPRTPRPLTPGSQGPGGSVPRTPGPLTPGSHGPGGSVSRTPGSLTPGSQLPMSPIPLGAVPRAKGPLNPEDSVKAAGNKGVAIPSEQKVHGEAPKATLVEPSKTVPGGGALITMDNKLLWESKTRGSFAKPFKSVEERKANVGKEGRKINLLTNHYNMKIMCTTVYRYDVEFTFPAWKRPPRKKDSDILYRAFEELKKKNQSKVFKNIYGVVFDGRKNIYSAHQLNLGSHGKDFQDSVTVLEVKDIPNQSVEVKAKIQYVGAFPLSDAIEEYERSGSSLNKPQDEINTINIILGYSSKLQFECLGKNIFMPGEGRVVELANGKSLWIGTFLSTRVGWKARLNIDMGNRPAYEEQPLMEFLCDFLRVRTFVDLTSAFVRDRFQLENSSKELFGLKVRFRRPDGHVRDFGVQGLKFGNSKNTKFPMTNKETGETIAASVYDYFRIQYKVNLKFPDLPVVHVGSKDKMVYLPMEFLTLKKQPCPITKRLQDDEAAIMIRHTAVPPAQRKQKIDQNLWDLNQGFNRDNFAKAFGLSIDSKMTKITGRVLEAPKIGYKNANNSGPAAICPRDGKWTMQYAIFNDGKSIKNWGCLDLANLPPPELDKFVETLMKEANSRNLKITPPEVKKSDGRVLNRVTNDFKALYQTLTKRGKPDLIMVFLQSKDNSLYGNIKTLGDLIYRIPTQVILKKNIFINQKSPQTIHNICLKLNSKMGGTNQMLHPSSRPEIFNSPVIMIGADVTHAPPSELGQKPSIAAVVGSVDPQATIYNAVISVQPRQEGTMATEKILKLEEIVRELLLKYYRQNGKKKPSKILYFRDGVSEGQFDDVMKCEISAIQRACTKLQADYEPGITFLVVQKRHNTRLFPENPRDGIGRMGNVPPGTVVDTDITNPTETSYFLASHEGIQGTTKPCCYHLLWDDNNFDSDSLQKLSYYLCHLYTRVERSVSYPAPTYYAHLAAFRARYHHNILCDQGKGDNPDEIKKMEKFDIPNYFV